MSEVILIFVAFGSRLDALCREEIVDNVPRNIENKLRIVMTNKRRTCNVMEVADKYDAILTNN
jgi:hypothetical protein